MFRENENIPILCEFSGSARPADRAGRSGGVRDHKLRQPKKPNKTGITKRRFGFLVQAVCVAGLLSAGVAGSMEYNGRALSAKDKEHVRQALYFLWETDEAKERKRAEIQSRRAVPLAIPLGELLRAVSEGTEGFEGKPSVENTLAFEQAADKAHEKIRYLWKIVLEESAAPYVRSLFQEDERLMDWIKKSPEALFSAVQFGNLDLTEFLVEEGGMINAARETTHFSPLHSAVISGRLRVIRFFLDHPDTDLSQKNIWGENMFHTVFLTGQENSKVKDPAKKRSDKWQVLSFLLTPKYFLRNYDLLTRTNHYNETALDLAEKDDMTAGMKKKIIRLLERKMKQAEQLKGLSKGDLAALRLKEPSEEELESLLLGLLSEGESLRAGETRHSPCLRSFSPSPPLSQR